MSRVDFTETDYSLTTDDEIINYQPSDFKNLSTSKKNQNLISSSGPVFLIKNSTSEKITKILKRFSIFLMNENKILIFTREDLKKETKEVLIDLIELPDENESISENSTYEFYFKITMDETIRLIGQLIKNKSYVFSKNASSELKEELVSSNNKMAEFLFDLSLKPVLENDIINSNEDANDDQENNINHFYFDESKDKVPEYTDIWKAIEEKDSKAVDYFIRIKNTNPNSKAWLNRTCLHYVSISGNLEMVKYLVSKGADINARDNDSNLSLHYACENGHLEIVKYFINDLNMDLNSKGWLDVTCLHYAANYGDLELVKYLVSKGADINARADDSDLPLHWVCLQGHLEIVKYFITDLNMDPYSKGQHNQICLHKAAKYGNLEVVKFLIENGGKKSLNVKDDFDETPLKLAELFNQKEIVDYLRIYL